DLAALSGIGKKTQDSLLEAGFKTLAQIAKAEVADLTKIKGIGKKKAEKLIAQAKGAKEDK
ncbi:MAG: helix-hairpin-helix domain-containing protein, partial [Omnitrophica bacterium]|nr:helix-hairpin-helix domain-containing protein [Candidatus Omnitrophota bacterium]